ncbi:MAG: alpha/beta fold hydrolase [Synechococcales bacterium]|nr:alpha/beta fold hydrolase [Synechococcales bacterium]
MVTLSHQTDERIWHWQGHAIAYRQAGERGIPVLLIHGFGAGTFHWRKNIPDLAQQFRVYAIDLMGFGRSAKPQPGLEWDYTFPTWGQQIRAFCQEVIGAPAVLVGNSIGCVVAMQAAVDEPTWVRGLALLNCSLRLLHDRKRVWYQQGAPYFQKLLQYTPLGAWFFRQIAQPKSLKKILLQAYPRAEAVTDELIQFLLEPAQQPGAVEVFLAFTGYFQGPLPEDLFPQLTCPTIVLWGTADAWEPIALGRAFADYPAVEQFIELEGLGHCPQDEAPEVVNPILQTWISQIALPQDQYQEQ